MGKLNPRFLVVKLDEYGYPGEALTLWTNFPGKVRDDWFALVGEEKIRAAMVEWGILHSTSLMNADGSAPLALTELPWDIYSVAAQALIAEINRISTAIFSPRNGKPAEAPKAEAVTG